jgi:hypothetical protein
VDLVYYGNAGKLEHDFAVAPGADPQAITLAFAATKKLSVDARGDLVMQVEGGDVRLEKPAVYQEVAGAHRPVACGYKLKKGDRVGFDIGEYDATKPLVIDPVLAYSTYLGGNGLDVGFGIAVDSAGNAYVMGATNSTNFPTTPGAFQTAFGGAADAFVTKLNATGTALVYSTYLGGSNIDAGLGIAVDSAGNAYVTGFTGSFNFPTTPGAFQTASGGGCDAFVTKLNATGTALAYSTYLGGGGSDEGCGIAVDSAGNAYVTGFTYSTNFPTTPGAFQTASGGAADAFVTKVNATGTALVYSTFLGGSSLDQGSGIAVDSAGNAYVTGSTGSSNFPTTPGAFQTSSPASSASHAFVTKISPSPSDLLAALINVVQGFNLNQGIANSLDVKLQAAENALGAMKANDITTACNQIGAFINAVQAQSGNMLTVDQANQLISLANQIKTLLGCP